MSLIRLNLGAGSIAQKDWVNVDIVDLPGIDLVQDLNVAKWPFADLSVGEILALDIVEHLDDPVHFITECWRILVPGGTLFIQTPRQDAEFLWIDPSHKRGFHEQSFDFFDPDKPFGQTTGFYSDAKFYISCKILPNKNLQFTLVKR